MLIQLGPPQRFTFLSTSMEVSETSMEVSIEGHGSKLPFMEASVEVGGSKLTSMEISMEVGGSRFTGSKLTSMEISMEVGGSRFTSIDVGGSFRGGTMSRKFPLSIEVEASIASIN